MKTGKSKLVLRVETLRSLTTGALDTVRGGIAEPTVIRNPPRYSDTPSCGIVCPPPEIRGEP